MPFQFEVHGRHTVLDHYTFKWFGGCQALALGLGSMFNHSQAPNVGFMRKQDDVMIEFTTLRDIAQGEELCMCVPVCMSMQVPYCVYHLFSFHIVVRCLRVCGVLGGGVRAWSCPQCPCRYNPS